MEEGGQRPRPSLSLEKQRGAKGDTTAAQAQGLDVGAPVGSRPLHISHLQFSSL